MPFIYTKRVLNLCQVPAVFLGNYSEAFDLADDLSDNPLAKYMVYSLEEGVDRHVWWGPWYYGYSYSCGCSCSYSCSCSCSCCCIVGLKMCASVPSQQYLRALVKYPPIQRTFARIRDPKCGWSSVKVNKPQNPPTSAQRVAQPYVGIVPIARTGLGYVVNLKRQLSARCQPINDPSNLNMQLPTCIRTSTLVKPHEM